MPGSLLWIAAAVVLGLGEIVIGRFWLGPLAVGALVAAVLSLAGLAGAGAVAAFVVVSSVVFAVGRSQARERRHPAVRVHPRAPDLVGRSASVIERIDNEAALGCIRLAGQAWTARAYHGGQAIDVGARVEVVGFRGVTALVEVADLAGEAPVERSVA